MEEELYHQCSAIDPTDFEVDQLIQLMNDEDCPHLITIEKGTYYKQIEHYTPIELLCKANESRKLKQLIEIKLLKHEKENESLKKDGLMDGTRALDFIFLNYNQYEDLLDIVRLLIERTRIDFNRPGLRLQRLIERDLQGARYLYKKPYDETNNQYLKVINIITEEPLLLSDFNEYDFNKPEFKISHIFQKYLNPLKRGPPFLNHHKAAATETLFKLHATIEERAMFQILPHLEPDLEENVTNLIPHLENLIEDLQFEFDHRRKDFIQNNFQISNLFESLFFNDWRDFRQSPKKIPYCQMIEMLIKSGLDINARDHEKEMNALHLLFRFCSEEEINALGVTKLSNEKSVDNNSKLIRQSGALHYLTYENDSCNEVEVVKLLIEKGIDVNAIDGYGMNTLHSLCRLYRGEHLIDIGKILLDNGVGIDTLGSFGRSALLCLCGSLKPMTNGMVAMMKLLIESGSDARAKDEYGHTGLHYLCNSFLLGPLDYYRPMESIQNNKRVEMAKLLLNDGVDINATDRSGQTALHCLLDGYSREDQKELVEFLIENGIDVDAKDKKERDALYYLENKYERGDKEEVKNLIINYIDLKCIPVAKKKRMSRID